MIHEPAKWAGWQSTTAAAQHLDRLKQMQSQIYRILSSRSGRPLRQIIRDTKRTDFYLDATKALEYGLIDKVLGVTHASTPVLVGDDAGHPRRSGSGGRDADARTRGAPGTGTRRARRRRGRGVAAAHPMKGSADAYPFRTLPAPSRFSIAIGLVAIVFLIDQSAGELIDDGSHFLLLGTAVGATAWFAGTGPALLATVLGAILGATRQR